MAMPPLHLDFCGPCVRNASPQPPRRARGAVLAAATAASPAAAPDAAADTGAPPTFDLCCPVCLTTPFSVRQVGGRPTGSLYCARCARTFGGAGAGAPYVDLTVASGARAAAWRARPWGGTALFQNPLISAAYERGWRQSFAWAGFPGADAEFEQALEYLEPARGGALLDASCGSGLFARRFLGSGAFSKVVALDYSEAMLRQARAYLDGDAALAASPRLALVRADVARLPLPTGGVAGVHAGAALHCWPDPQAAMSEISRVLAPGGVLVASTFLTAAAPLGALLGDDAAVRPLGRLLDGPPGAPGRAMRWFEEAELRDLCAAVGLADFRRHRSNRFIMFAATKPGGEGEPWERGDSEAA